MFGNILVCVATTSQEQLRGFSKTAHAQDEMVSTMDMVSSSAFHLSVSLTSRLSATVKCIHTLGEIRRMLFLHGRPKWP